MTRTQQETEHIGISSYAILNSLEKALLQPRETSSAISTARDLFSTPLD